MLFLTLNKSTQIDKNIRQSIESVRRQVPQNLTNQVSLLGHRVSEASKATSQAQKDITNAQIKITSLATSSKLGHFEREQNKNKDLLVQLGHANSGNMHLYVKNNPVDISAAALNANGEGTYDATFPLLFSCLIDGLYYPHQWMTAAPETPAETPSFNDVDITTIAIDDPAFDKGVINYAVQFPTGAAYTYLSGDYVEYALKVRWNATDDKWLGFAVASVTMRYDIIA